MAWWFRRRKKVDNTFSPPVADSLLSDSVAESFKYQIANAKSLGIGKKQIRELERMLREYEQSIAAFKRQYVQQTQAAEREARARRMEAERLRRQAEMRPRVVMPPPHDPPIPMVRRMAPPKVAAEEVRVVVTPQSAPQPNPVVLQEDYEGDQEPIDIVIKKHHRRWGTRPNFGSGRGSRKAPVEPEFVEPLDPDTVGNAALADALRWNAVDRCSQPGCLTPLVNGQCPQNHKDNWQAK